MLEENEDQGNAKLPEIIPKIWIFFLFLVFAFFVKDLVLDRFLFLFLFSEMFFVCLLLLLFRLLRELYLFIFFYQTRNATLTPKKTTVSERTDIEINGRTEFLM